MVMVSIVLRTVLFCIIMVGVMSDVAARCICIDCVVLGCVWTMLTVHPTAPTLPSVVSTWTGHQVSKAHFMYKCSVQLCHPVHEPQMMGTYCL